MDPSAFISSTPSHSPALSPGLLYFSRHYHQTPPPSTTPNQSVSNPPRLPSELPPNPFSCLDSLRALEKNLTQPSSSHQISPHLSDWSTGLNRFVVRSPVDQSPGTPNPINSDPVFEDEELCWKGSRLIWSKGNLIHRMFEYSSNSPFPSLDQDSSLNPSRQHVVQALFAYFDPPSFNPSYLTPHRQLDHPLSALDDRPLSPQLDHPEGLPPEFHLDPPIEPWSDNRLTPRSDQQKRWRLSSISPVRALCVLLSDVLKIYFDTGEEYALAVPFPIQKVWPIERGVMLMKKPTSVRPRPFIPTNHASPGPSNQLKLRNMCRKSTFGGGDTRWPSATYAPSTSEFMVFDSMITENETRLWSNLSGFDLDDRQLRNLDQLEDDDEDVDEREISAELARYWAERKQIESSMLWTLSDPCTHYFQPVLTTEKIILPNLTNQSISANNTDPLHNAQNSNFCSAFVPLVPLATPPRRPGCALSSGTVVYVADPIADPLHPICITASTEGFAILLYGRLPSTVSTSSGLLTPFEPSSPIGIPEEELLQDDASHNLTRSPRSPTPPPRPTTTEEPQLRRSPRKTTASQSYLASLEPIKSARPAPRSSIDAHKLSPTFSRSNPPPARLGGLGHPSLRRSLNHPPGPSTTSFSTKKRGMHAASAASSNMVGGRRVSVVSNVSNTSFAFASTAGQSATIHGGNPTSKPSARKSLAEQQLEMMSGTVTGHRIGTGNSDKVVNTVGLDREAGGGFEEWFDGIMDSEPSDRKIEGHLADEALEPEFIIQTLETVDVPGRLTVEELPSIHATLYDSRGAMAYLAVCIPTKATVYVFRITRTPDSIRIKSLGKPWEGTAIGPVLCSRSNVYDLFKFSNSTGMTEVFSADSTFIHQLPHPDTNWSPERSVKPSVGSHVDFVSPHSITQNPSGALPINVRLDLKLWPVDLLTRKVFQVISEDIGNAQVSNLIQRLIKYNMTGKSFIACLETVLYEAVIGEEIRKPRKLDGEPMSCSTDATSIIHSIDELNSDPVLKHLRSMQRFGQSNHHELGDPLPSKPHSSHRKRRLQPAIDRGLALNSEQKIKLMISLARLYAELKVSISSLGQHITLGKILFKLSSSLGWVDWIDNLKRSLNGILEVAASFSIPSATKLKEPRMPDLFDHLDRIRLAINSPFDELFERRGDYLQHPTHPYHRSNLGFYGAQESCPRSKQISRLYRIIFKPDQAPLECAKNVLIEIDRFGWNHEDLDDLWFGVAVPLKEALRFCQQHAPHGLPIRCYQLMGRPDLCMLTDYVIETDSKDDRAQTRTASRKIPSIHITSQQPPSISQLCAAAVPIEDPVIPPSVELYQQSSETDSNNSNVAALFCGDMRILDVAKMLNYTQETKVTMHESIAEMTSTDVARQYSNFFVGIIKRTMSLPFGGACFWYKTDSNVAASVPMIKLDIRISSPAILIQPDLSKVEPLGWPRFHAGVAAGLSLSVKSEEFDSSQISLARPEELDDRHAGYLFGLGLNQHLRSINRVQIFRYLETKHEMTSIGVLLGLSSAFIGTSDPRVNSIIAAHVPAMHPTDSVQLQVSPLTQSAGFIGFGILHLGTANRRLSDGMLREMGRTWRVLTDTPGECRESYTLCAGLGYGLVMLGRGTESDTPAHKDLMRTFKCLIQGDGAHPLPGLNQPTMTIDVSVTSPAATLALALLYLKTGRVEVAMLCEIPQTPARLEYIRPDLLMIRTLARGLIMWESIETEMSWMESFVPSVILEAIKSAEAQKKRLKAYWEMSYWSIICGAALSMALKYAGSADSIVHSTLLKIYDRLLKAISKPALNVQAKVLRNCLRTCHNSVTLGLAIVMAGTGDLQLLKRLRLAHGNTTDTTGYGIHVVTHLALGLLFLGGGRYTLSTSNRAVACLVCALYPIFPARSDDQVHHLQALRHLWALAVEPRCLVARDVSRKGELIFLPIKLETQEAPSRSAYPQPLIDREQMNIGPREASGPQARSDFKTQYLTAPTLIPELSKIRSLEVESLSYWPFVLDLTHNENHRKYFSKSLSLWVKKKVGCSSYSQDPKGTQSIDIRGRGAEEMMTCELDDFGVRSQEIRRAMNTKLDYEAGTEEVGQESLYDLVGGLDFDPQSTGLVNNLCSLIRLSTNKEKLDGWIFNLSAYSSTALLGCLLEDKLDIFPIYLALFACSQSLINVDGSNFKIDYIPDQEWQISSLISFYDGGHLNDETDFNLRPSNSCLLDKSLLVQMQRKHQEDLIHWAETDGGERLIMDYLRSNGEVDHDLPRSTTDLTRKKDEEDLGQEIGDEVRLIGWLKLMNVPLPRTLKLLRNFLIQELKNYQESNDGLLSHSPSSIDRIDPNHPNYLRFQFLVKKILSIHHSSHHHHHHHHHHLNSGSIDNHQFLNLLVRSCWIVPS